MALNYKSSLARYRRYLQIAEQKPLLKATLFLSLSLILVVVLLIVAIRPTAMKIAEIRGKIEKQQSLSETLNDKIVKDQQAAALLEKNRDRLGVLYEGLPMMSNWKEWTLSLEQIAERTKVEVESVTIGENQIKGKYTPDLKNTTSKEFVVLPTQVNEMTVNVVSIGSYQQLVQFVNELEKSRRILVMSVVEFDKQTDGKLKLIINGKVGYITTFNDL